MKLNDDFIQITYGDLFLIVPEWVRWVAADEDGALYGFGSPPLREAQRWDNKGTKIKLCNVQLDSPNEWETSLKKINILMP